MIRDLLLVVGLLTSASTQLRLGNLPLGPGELCLATWLALTLCLQTARPGLAVNAALTAVVTFWLILFAAESVGLIVGFTTELFFDTAHIIHDIIAYLLLFGLGCMMAIELASERRRRRVTWLVALCGAASLGLQASSGFGWLPLPLSVEPWFYDRLRGWSKDPNQLGFLTASLTLLSLHLAQTATARTETLAAGACGALALAVGVLTKSDSFVLCLLTTVPILSANKAWLWMGTLHGGLSFRAALVCIAFLGTPMILVAAVPFVPAAIERLQAQSDAVYNEDGQGDARFRLWTEAIEKGVDAAMLGLGPGPHLLSKAWKRPPPSKFEAHNTPLDLFAQGGLFAVLALAWLYVSVFVATVRARLGALAALSCGFVVFSMFHFIIRHPIFWFGVVLCLLEAASVLQRLRAHSPAMTTSSCGQLA